MKRSSLTFLGVFSISALVFICIFRFKNVPPAAFQEEKEENEKAYPSDWMYAQRAYPDNQINREAYREAWRVTQLAREKAHARGAGLWEVAGPLNIGGRITSLALHPTDQNIIYAGAASGGVFKSTDGGATWAAIFENEGSMSVGNLALAPSEPNTIYLGTGEANGSFDSGAYFGEGVWKSTDSGATWEHKGLENTNHIGRLAIDPQNANRVYVAAAGVLYGKNEDRGLYRTLDGGQSWEKVLYLSDSTACIDVVVNPLNADIVFAATWERIRFPWQRKYGGLTSRIYRSKDGGDTWEQLTNGLPPDHPQRGRIGLAISPSNPDVVYAAFSTDAITNVFDGLYKTTNGGDSWAKVDDGSIASIYSSFGWYFGKVRVSPFSSDNVWVLGVQLGRSLNGGANWQTVTNGMHVDFHALEVHPQNPDFMVAGNDGGVYISNNAGASWTHVEVLPITQFYNCEIDNLQPERLFGGAQDNGTMRTVTGNLDDWERILGGDGFHVIVDPTDNNYVYAEYQYGNLFRSSDGGATMQFIFNGGFDDRTNWNTPVVLDPNDPATIYYGANVLHRSNDRGNTWIPISGDLTNGEFPGGSLAYGTLTAIAVAPENSQVIYTGSDDGNVHVTFNGGNNWTKISNSLPNRYVTALAVHPGNALKAIVTFSGFRNTDYQPHVLRTNDGGETWEDISANLPEIPVNDIIIDPDFPDDVYYVANDLGVWYTIDGGVTWEVLGSNLPYTVVADLKFHQGTRTLLAGTYGRSMLKYDASNIAPVASKEQAQVAGKLQVFPNPVSGKVRITFQLDKAAKGNIRILNLSGQLVQTFDEQLFVRGGNLLEWDASGLPAGVYLLRFQCPGEILTVRVVKQ